MSTNRFLTGARKTMNDEFYTQLSDIERELRHYTSHFKGKTVFCNCDDPRFSNFFHYFSHNFERLGLKRFITACYKNIGCDLFNHHVFSKRAVWLDYQGDSDIEVGEFEGNGDFQNYESIEFLKQADIVVTNPPFSLFREYVAQLVSYHKKFLIIGNMNASTYKEVFPLIRERRIWLGVSKPKWFVTPYEYWGRTGKTSGKKGRNGLSLSNVRWFTNLDHQKRNEDLVLYKKYTSEEYPHYDNYDAINVNKTVEIPMDYNGPMGVPITFLDKWNPDQFDILGVTESEGAGLSNGIWFPESRVLQPLIQGRKKYKRIFIRNRRLSQ